MTIEDWVKWYIAEQRGATREEVEMAIAESLGYWSNTLTPTLFQKEFEKMLTESDGE